MQIDRKVLFKTFKDFPLNSLCSSDAPEQLKNILKKKYNQDQNIRNYPPKIYERLVKLTNNKSPNNTKSNRSVGDMLELSPDNQRENDKYNENYYNNNYLISNNSKNCDMNYPNNCYQRPYIPKAVGYQPKGYYIIDRNPEVYNDANQETWDGRQTEEVQTTDKDQYFNENKQKGILKNKEAETYKMYTKDKDKNIIYLTKKSNKQRTLGTIILSSQKSNKQRRCFSALKIENEKNELENQVYTKTSLNFYNSKTYIIKKEIDSPEDQGRNKFDPKIRNGLYTKKPKRVSISTKPVNKEYQIRNPSRVRKGRIASALEYFRRGSKYVHLPITRAMRIDKGGVVDLLLPEQKTSKDNEPILVKRTKGKTCNYSTKTYVKNAQIIQKWWRKIKDEYKIFEIKVKYLQRIIRKFLNRLEEKRNMNQNLNKNINLEMDDDIKRTKGFSDSINKNLNHKEIFISSESGTFDLTNQRQNFDKNKNENNANTLDSNHDKRKKYEIENVIAEETILCSPIKEDDNNKDNSQINPIFLISVGLSLLKKILDYKKSQEFNYFINIWKELIAQQNDKKEDKKIDKIDNQNVNEISIKISSDVDKINNVKETSCQTNNEPINKHKDEKPKTDDNKDKIFIIENNQFSLESLINKNDNKKDDDEIKNIKTNGDDIINRNIKNDFYSLNRNDKNKYGYNINKNDNYNDNNNKNDNNKSDINKDNLDNLDNKNDNIPNDINNKSDNFTATKLPNIKDNNQNLIRNKGMIDNFYKGAADRSDINNKKNDKDNKSKNNDPYKNDDDDNNTRKIANNLENLNKNKNDRDEKKNLKDNLDNKISNANEGRVKPKVIPKIGNLLYKKVFKFPFDQIKNEAKRRVLIKAFRNIKNIHNPSILYAFKKIKKYGNVRYQVMNAFATIIQREFRRYLYEKKLNEMKGDNNEEDGDEYEYVEEVVEEENIQNMPKDDKNKPIDDKNKPIDDKNKQNDDKNKPKDDKNKPKDDKNKEDEIKKNKDQNLNIYKPKDLGGNDYTKTQNFNNYYKPNENDNKKKDNDMNNYNKKYNDLDLNKRFPRANNRDINTYTYHYVADPRDNDNNNNNVINNNNQNNNRKEPKRNNFYDYDPITSKTQKLLYNNRDQPNYNTKSDLNNSLYNNNPNYGNINKNNNNNNLNKSYKNNIPYPQNYNTNNLNYYRPNKEDIYPNNNNNINNQQNNDKRFNDGRNNDIYNMPNNNSVNNNYKNDMNNNLGNCSNNNPTLINRYNNNQPPSYINNNDRENEINEEPNKNSRNNYNDPSKYTNCPIHHCCCNMHCFDAFYINPPEMNNYISYDDNNRYDINKYGNINYDNNFSDDPDSDEYKFDKPYKNNFNNRENSKEPEYNNDICGNRYTYYRRNSDSVSNQN